MIYHAPRGDYLPLMHTTPCPACKVAYFLQAKAANRFLLYPCLSSAEALNSLRNSAGQVIRNLSPLRPRPARRSGADGS